MDSYLACLAQKELDKGIKVKHEVVSTMTNIINDTHVVNIGKKVWCHYKYSLGDILHISLNNNFSLLSISQ